MFRVMGTCEQCWDSSSTRFNSVRIQLKEGFPGGYGCKFVWND